MGKPRVVIIGPGRMGQGLALALKRRGYAVTLVGRTQKDVAPSLSLYTGDLGGAVRDAELILIATPDDAIRGVAVQLAETGAIGRDTVVLHLSGLLDRTALEPLDASGAALGSFHPLQTVVDANTTAERLKGAYAGVEGDDRAVVVAERLANTLRMTSLRLASAAKPAYHAGATFVANYTAALLGVGERLAVRAGVAPELAAQIYLPLLTGAVANLSTLGPTEALTGAVRRGDTETINTHMLALEPDERQLYKDLGFAALKLARAGGLDEKTAKRVETALSKKR